MHTQHNLVQIHPCEKHHLPCKAPPLTEGAALANNNKPPTTAVILARSASSGSQRDCQGSLRIGFPRDSKHQQQQHQQREVGNQKSFMPRLLFLSAKVPRFWGVEARGGGSGQQTSGSEVGAQQQFQEGRLGTIWRFCLHVSVCANSRTRTTLTLEGRSDKRGYTGERCPRQMGNRMSRSSTPCT